MLYTGKYVIISFNKSVDYYHTTSCINSYRFFLHGPCFILLTPNLPQDDAKKSDQMCMLLEPTGTVVCLCVHVKATNAIRKPSTTTRRRRRRTTIVVSAKILKANHKGNSGLGFLPFCLCTAQHTFGMVWWRRRTARAFVSFRALILHSYSCIL